MIEPASPPRPLFSMFDPEPQQGRETSLREFLSILRRRKMIAIQTFILVLAMGIAVTFMTRPTYRSTTRILVEGKSAMISLNDTKDPLANLFLPQSGHEVNTQVEVLRSPALLEKVARAANTSLKQVDLTVQQVGQTDVIEIGVTAADRDLARNFADKLPQIYLQDVQGGRLREVSSALEFAQRRLKERNLNLQRAEAALEQFKSSKGVVNTGEEKTQDIGALGAARVTVRQAEADYASAVARLDALQDTRRGLPSAIETRTLSSNPQIVEVQNKIAALQADRKQKTYLFKPDQDEVKQIDAQITDLQQRLQRMPREVTSVNRSANPSIPNFDEKIAEARATANASRAALREARERAQSLSRSLGRYNPIERTQTQLERDITEGQSAVTMLANSVEELSLRQKATAAKDAPITIIAQAGRGTQVTPKVFRDIFLALLLGLFLGCAAALIQDSLDDHLNAEDEVRWLLDTPVLGHLPVVAEGRPNLISLENGDGNLLERFRVLRSSVQFTQVNQRSRSMMVTSTIPSEGKTSTVSNLAIAMALDARRIILVDADLHRPRLDKVFDLPRNPGLSNVLASQCTWQEAIQETDIPGLRVLTAGVLPPNPAELLNSTAMEQLLRQLEEDSDMVIFDSPPCLATADAQVLSAKVDGVLYIMELGKIRKSAVLRSFELLHQAQAHVLGIVFNKVDKANQVGNYYNYYYYDYYKEGTPDELPTPDGAKRRRARPSFLAPKASGDDESDEDNYEPPNGNGSSGYNGAANGAAHGTKNGKAVSNPKVDDA